MATRDVAASLASKEYVDAALATVRAEIALEFTNLHRYLRVTGASIVGVTVALSKRLP